MLFANWRRLPDLARGLPDNVTLAEAMFDERVRSRFPVGSSEAELVAHLRQEGFEAPDSSKDGRGVWHDATFWRRRWPFRTLWSVRWRARAGELEEVWGVHGIVGP